MSKLKPKEKPHYVNNRDFSEAVYDYAKEAVKQGSTSLGLKSDSHVVSSELQTHHFSLVSSWMLTKKSRIGLDWTEKEPT